MESHHSPDASNGPTSISETNGHRFRSQHCERRRLTISLLRRFGPTLLLLVFCVEGSSQVTVLSRLPEKTASNIERKDTTSSLLGAENAKITSDSLTTSVHDDDRTFARSKQTSILKRLLTFPLRIGRAIISALTPGEGRRSKDDSTSRVGEVVDSKILVDEAIPNISSQSVGTRSSDVENENKSDVKRAAGSDNSKLAAANATSEYLEAGSDQSTTATQRTRIVDYLNNSEELRKSFSCRFTGQLRTIPNALQTDLKQALPQYKFYVARMEVLVDPPSDFFDVKVISDAATGEVLGHVWDPYWTLKPSASFENLLKGRRFTSTEDAIKQVQSLARLLTYSNNSKVGPASVKKGRIRVELLAGKVLFRVLEVKITDLRFGSLAITGPDGKRRPYFATTSNTRTYELSTVGFFVSEAIEPPNNISTNP